MTSDGGKTQILNELDDKYLYANRRSRNNRDARRLSHALAKTDERVPCAEFPEAWCSPDPDEREFAASLCWRCPIAKDCPQFGATREIVYRTRRGTFSPLP